MDENTTQGRLRQQTQQQIMAVGGRNVWLAGLPTVFIRRSNTAGKSAR